MRHFANGKFKGSRPGLPWPGLPWPLTYCGADFRPEVDFIVPTRWRDAGEPVNNVCAQCLEGALAEESVLLLREFGAAYTGMQAGQALVWDGTAWVPRP